MASYPVPQNCKFRTKCSKCYPIVLFFMISFAVKTTAENTTTAPMISYPNPTTPDQLSTSQDSGLPIIDFIAAGVSLFLIAAFVIFLGLFIRKRLALSNGNDETPENFENTVCKFNEICQSENRLTSNEFRISKCSLKLPIKSGLFSSVYKGSFKRNCNWPMYETVIVKKTRWSGISSDISRVESFMQEVRAFQYIGNGNSCIVGFLGACCDKNGLFVLTEFCEGGTLTDYLLENFRPKYIKENLGENLPLMELDDEDDSEIDQDYINSWVKNKMLEDAGVNLNEVSPSLDSKDLVQLLKWCEQIAEGMEYLGLKGIIHLGLTTMNILLKGGNIKISGFGSSKEYCDNSTISGALYLSSFTPEINGDTPCSLRMSIDVWAYGCTLWEIFSLGSPLYPDVVEMGIGRFQEISRLMTSGYRHPKPELAPDSVYEIMMKCWEEEPEKRPSFNYLRMYFQVLKLADK